MPSLQWTHKEPFTMFHGNLEDNQLNIIEQPNQLYCMGNKKFLCAYKGRLFDLVYIDPPFFTNKKFTNTKNELAYNDTWDNFDEYLDFMWVRLNGLKCHMASNASIYVHCDYRTSAYLRCMLDEIFGYDNFRNEIIWSYGLGGSSKKCYSRKHDNILYYVNDINDFYFDKPVEPATSTLLKGKNKGARDVWKYEDLIELTLSNQDKERCGYPTQKPSILLKRIIESSCPIGGLVCDIFAGSGTTLKTAHSLGRNWVGVDNSPLAISTIQSSDCGPYKLI